jgi:hypothetical protein
VGFRRPSPDAEGGRSKSSQDDNLAARFVLLYAAMRLDDVVELEDFADLDPQRPRGGSSA